MSTSENRQSFNLAKVSRYTVYGCYGLFCISDLILIFLHQHVQEFKIFKINPAVRGF